MTMNDPEPQPAPVLPPRSRGMTRLRNYFLTGVILAAPITITAWLTWSVIGWIDGWIKPLIPARYSPDTYLPFAVPGFGVLVVVVSLTLLGFLTANLVGRSLVALGDRILGSMPLIRSIYGALKQIFETTLSSQSKSFKKAALIQYPRQGIWSLAFIAGDASEEVTRHVRKAAGGGEEQVVSVYVPTTPAMTSGFLLFIKTDDVIELDLTIEEAAKLVMSAGLVTPEQAAREKAREAARRRLARRRTSAAEPAEPS